MPLAKYPIKFSFKFRCDRSYKDRKLNNISELVSVHPLTNQFVGIQITCKLCQINPASSIDSLVQKLVYRAEWDSKPPAQI